MIVTMDSDNGFEFVIGFSVKGRDVRSHPAQTATREQLLLIAYAVDRLLESEIDRRPPSGGAH